jgi:hypothetical protein
MFFPIVFVYLTMVVIINSFGYFMTIKKEENDIEQDKDTLEDKIDSADELTLVINPLEQVHDMPNTNDCVTLPI